MMGKRPKRPKDRILPDGLWRITQRCLEENPRRRPGITEVIFHLRKTLAGLREPMVSKSTCSLIPGYQLWRRYKSGMSIRENGTTSDSRRSAKSGEPDACEGVEFAHLQRSLSTMFRSIMIATTGIASTIIGKHSTGSIHPNFTHRLWELAQSPWRWGRPRIELGFSLLLYDERLIRRQLQKY